MRIGIEADREIEEGDDNNKFFNLTVTSDITSDRDINLRCETRDGTAISGQDYQAHFGFVEIMAGQTSGICEMVSYGDAIKEADKTFEAVIEQFEDGDIEIVRDATTITIVDDDELEVTLLDAVAVEGEDMTFIAYINEVRTTPLDLRWYASFEPGYYRAKEDEVGATIGTVTFGPGGSVMPGDQVTVPCDLLKGTNPASADGETDLPGEDMERVCDTEGNTTVTIPSGTTVGTFTIPIVEDAVDESRELFKVNVGSFTRALQEGETGQAWGVIVDNDSLMFKYTLLGTEQSFTTIADINLPTVQGLNLRVPEEQGTMTLAFEYIGEFEPEIPLVMITTPWTAVPGKDYKPVQNVVLTITPESKVVHLHIDIVNDNEVEGLEYFTVGFLPLNDNDIGLPVLNFDVFIYEASAEVGASVSNETVIAGEDLEFEVTLARTSVVTVEVDYETQIEAGQADSSDFTPVNGTLVFAPGESRKTVRVQTVQDADTAHETFKLVLTGVRNGDHTAKRRCGRNRNHPVQRKQPGTGSGEGDTGPGPGERPARQLYLPRQHVPGPGPATH